MFASSQLLNALLQITLILPLLFFGKGKFNKEEYRMLGIFIVLFILWTVITKGLEGVVVGNGQSWNWVGKMGGLLLGVFFVYRNKLITHNELGWKFRFNSGTVKPVVVTLFVILLARFLFYITFERHEMTFDLETLIYQGTLSGLCDELLFRGILLALLNRVFTAKENVFGFTLSYGILISSILFGLSQGLLLDKSFHEGFHLKINLLLILIHFFLGLIAAVFKERSGSLLPAIVFHNLWALIANH